MGIQAAQDSLYPLIASFTSLELQAFLRDTEGFGWGVNIQSLPLLSEELRQICDQAISRTNASLVFTEKEICRGHRLLTEICTII